VVLCVGALQKRKNQAGLVRAFRAMPKDWRLVLAGSNGYGAEEVFTEIERSGCADRILVTGYIPDERLAEWYARARIFAFPSFDEGFGMPVLEAMAAGLPVLTSNRSALPEVAGECALLVEPSDDDRIAAGLLKLANEGEPCKCPDVAARFTWSDAVSKTLDVYRELLGKS
jgi:glycosyltransferase involved in cell wall biosynthesis